MAWILNHNKSVVHVLCKMHRNWEQYQGSLIVSKKERKNNFEFQYLSGGTNVTDLCSSITGSNSTLLDVVESDISSTNIWLLVVLPFKLGRVFLN